MVFLKKKMKYIEIQEIIKDQNYFNHKFVERDFGEGASEWQIRYGIVFAKKCHEHSRKEKPNHQIQP